MENNHTEWQPERLVERYNTLQESLTIPHSPERVERIRRELSLVAFEIHQRIYVDETIILEEVEEDSENEEDIFFETGLY
jgi:hypothetical protein